MKENKKNTSQSAMQERKQATPDMFYKKNDEPGARTVGELSYMEDINAGIEADIREDNDEVESDTILENMDHEGS